MADTITVALRVAEEAIDEAITKAEAYTDSQVRKTSSTDLFLVKNVLKYLTFYSQTLCIISHSEATTSILKIHENITHNIIKSALIIVVQQHLAPLIFSGFVRKLQNLHCGVTVSFSGVK